MIGLAERARGLRGEPGLATRAAEAFDGRVGRPIVDGRGEDTDAPVEGLDVEPWFAEPCGLRGGAVAIARKVDGGAIC